MEQGWDPDVKKYFRKILNSFSFGLLWLMTNVTLGIYFGLAFKSSLPLFVIILFYVFLAGSLGLLLWYYYRVWRK